MDQSEVDSSFKNRPSLLLWIDGRADTAEEVPDRLRALCVARECNIPVHELHANRLTSADIRRFFASIAKPRKSGRISILAIGGHFLEDQVSRCCLQTLAGGFDTHLLCDVVFALDKSMFQNHLTRLTQAGVVPSSLNQMTAFLMADEVNADVIAKLKNQIRLAD